jgi:hypothetical protein
MPAQGLATLDEAFVTGAGGLSLIPTPQRLESNGRRYWTWCALDALDIPALMGGKVVVHSRTAPEGTPVMLRFEDGHGRDRDPARGIRSAAPQVARSPGGRT